MYSLFVSFIHLVFQFSLSRAVCMSALILATAFKKLCTYVRAAAW